jgi:hypothetical protein
MRHGMKSASTAFITCVPGQRPNASIRMFPEAAEATPEGIGSGKGLAHALNNIMRHCRENGITRFYVMDDDLVSAIYKGSRRFRLGDIEWPGDCALGSSNFGCPLKGRPEFEEGVGDQFNFYDLGLIPGDISFTEDFPVWEVLNFGMRLKERGLKCLKNNMLEMRFSLDCSNFSRQYCIERNKNFKRAWGELGRMP